MSVFSRECGVCGYKVKFCKCVGVRASGRTHGSGSASVVNPKTGQTAIRQPSKDEHKQRCREQGYRAL